MCGDRSTKRISEAPGQVLLHCIIYNIIRPIFREIYLYEEKVSKC